MRPWFLLCFLLAGCGGSCWWDMAPGQPQLIVYEDGTTAADPVRTFVGYGDNFVLIACRKSLKSREVQDATARVFRDHPYAAIAIRYRYSGKHITTTDTMIRQECIPHEFR